MATKKKKATKKTAKTEPKDSLTINIQGDLIGDEDYIEMLAEKISEAVIPIPELQNTVINGHDRMARYQRHPPCPKCDAKPSVCMMRRPGYASYRCRQCGYRWEVK